MPRVASENATQHRALMCDNASAEADNQIRAGEEEVNHDQTKEAQVFLERLATGDVGLFPGISPIRFFVPQCFHPKDWEE